MSLQPPEPDLRNIWQNQETEKTTMSIEDVRIKARRLMKRQQRDLIVRSAFAIIAVVFCGVVFMRARIATTGAIAGLVTAMLLASTARNLYLAFRRSRNDALENSSNTALTSCLEFYRSELERQRQVARQPLWQLVAALLIVAWLVPRPLMRSNMDLLRAVLPVVLLAAAILIVLMALRKFQARRVQEDIDALDAFEEENH
ncbi:MAG TPA: hypothetical protein VK210_08430 [Terriglobia bacterium]|nr:hypothetical protein [Terriglobia bacterium]